MPSIEAFCPALLLQCGLDGHANRVAVMTPRIGS
jgi:hypothetical protein